MKPAHGTTLHHEIAKRNRAETALRDSEARFGILAETTPAAIFIFHQTQICYVNPAAESITGYSRQELLKMNFWEVIHPDLQNFIKANGLARQQSNSGVPSQQKTKLLTKSGQERWVEVSLGVIELEGETSVLGTAFDITAHEQARAERERLLKIEHEQRLLAETLGEVFLAFATQTTDRKAVLDEILYQTQRVVPYTAANIMLLETDYLHIVRWHGYKANEAFYSGLKQSLVGFPLDEEVVRNKRPLFILDTHQDSRWVITPESDWIRSFIAVPLYLNDHVLGLLRLDSDGPGTFSQKDIERLMPLAHAAAIALESAQLYDRLQAELDRRTQAEQELRRAATRTQAILNAIPDSLFYFSYRGELLDYKAVKEDELLLEALEKMPVKEGAGHPGNLSYALANSFQQHIDQAHYPDNVDAFEFQYGSEVRKQDFEARFVKFDPGKVLAIVRNTTIRRQAERQAIRTEHLAALGQLAATLAHEINNPIQAIMANLDLVLDFPVGEDVNRQSLQSIRQEIERLKDITQRILHYARPKTTCQQNVFANQLVEQALMLSGKQLEQKRVQVSTNFQDIPAVLAAPGQLLQVFLNLVINAAEVVPDNNPQLKIAVYAHTGNVIASFTNNGPAIPAENLPHIFEPFFSTKEEGSGLGLWVSRMIIEQHKGSLTVKNLSDYHGAIFTVRLPAVSSNL